MGRFFQECFLREGLDFHNEKERGYISVGLIKEIRALAAKPIPWDVELGMLFPNGFHPYRNTGIMPGQAADKDPHQKYPDSVISSVMKTSETGLSELLWKLRVP